MIRSFTREQQSHIDCLIGVLGSTFKDLSTIEVWDKIIEIEAAQIFYYATKMDYNSLSLSYKDRPDSQTATKREAIECRFGGENSLGLRIKIDGSDNIKFEAGLKVISYDSERVALSFENQSLQNALNTFAQHLFAHSRGFTETEVKPNAYGIVEITKDRDGEITISVHHTQEVVSYKHFTFCC